MSKYINADEILSLFNEEYKRTRKLIEQGETHLDNLAEGYLEAQQVISRMPSADVVEVVRCKECKHYIEPYCFRFLNTDISRYSVTPNDYCSSGERKETE